ncbi:MAG: hypothetical protein J5525_14385 [Lachnospiraceae bacterium]|nr:hypothetical protein [Lachnospiraceae bacterium]
MFIRADYNTNAVPGTFFRPHDYMAHVPTERITGTDSVSFSEEGLQLSSQIDTSKYVKSAGTPIANITTSANQEARLVNRYIYSSADGQVSLINMAV